MKLCRSRSVETKKG